MKVLIYGSRGWIASYVISELMSHDHEIVAAYPSRADDEDMVRKDLDLYQPTHVLSLIGRTHGPGFSTIDYLEQPGKLVDNIKDNLYGPMVLALECKKRNIHFTYLGTGCIFSGPSEKLYDEDDKPDFFGSSYSVVKGFTDRLMHLLHDTVLNVRIRMPITSDDSPRNFINKITTYKKICSMPNSMSVLPSLVPYIVRMMEMKHVGTINMTNPGIITHNDILEMYRDIVDPTFSWENFTEQEQDCVLQSKRSNNHLDTTKLEMLFPDVPSIYSAVEACLLKMVNTSYQTDFDSFISDDI